MHVWSQVTSLALATAGFGFAVVPSRSDPGRSSSEITSRLFRWPFFWLGLALLGYVEIQGLNPAWRYVTDGKTWTLVTLDPIPWLPSGVDAPFGISNPWRDLLVLGSAWLMLCSVGIGFTRRHSFRVLFSVLAVNAGLVAVVGIAERLTLTSRILWAYVPSNPEFAATFIYRNHAGAYLDLMAAVCVGLAWWHYRRVKRQIESPAFAVLYAFIAGLLLLMVVFSGSRTSTAILVVFALIAAAGFAFGAASTRSAGMSRRDVGVVTSGLVVCALLGLISLRSDALVAHFSEFADSPTASLESRKLARQASVQMLRDRAVFGWGAGCFRYGFPIYQQQYPEIYQFPSGLRQIWEHAHDDLIEIPVELGILGTLPLLAIVAWGAWVLLRASFWKNPVSYCLVAACVLTVGHASLDFVFQCPAVLLTWSFLALAARRWSELDRPPQPGRFSPQTASIPERGAALRP
jgi:O-antigen ligase